MALNPNGTRQRDGSAQLSQMRKEFRLFDENSSNAISPVFEVWNEPVVIHVHGLAPGQGVAVDCVSDYDNNPVYTPFTPVRGQAIVLADDLTSVVLFFSGRYVLRLTAGGLGTVRAFAYPFSVSHDWGDYYGGLGLTGVVVTSIDDIDTNTINITLNPDPGTGDVTIRADAILSPDVVNILEFRANGMFVRGPDNGPPNVVPTSVVDTATIDMTLAANVLSAVVIRSPDINQILQLRANGVYVPGPPNGDPVNVPTSVLDTQSVDLTLALNVLSADVIISPDAGNALSILPNGLYAAGFAGTITTAADTNTIDHTVSVGVLTSQVIKSPDAGNLLDLRVNGVYVGVGSAVTSVTDTQSIDLTLAANNLQADLRIDPSAENALNLSAAGVIVEQATTAEEEAETAGDLVINAITLGHIVNARTGTQSAHLGVNAGNLATRQVSVGYQSGTGVSNTGNIAVGANSGQSVTGAANIYIGDNCGPDSGTGNAGRTNVVRIAGNVVTGASKWTDGAVIIGNAYVNATNIGTLASYGVPDIVAIGSGSLTQFNYNGALLSNPLIGIGSQAGYLFTSELNGLASAGIIAIGAASLKNSKANAATAVGLSAGENFMLQNLGRKGPIDAMGWGAGFQAYATSFNKNFNGSLFLGTSAGGSIEYPRKTYVYDTSKFAIISPATVTVVDPSGNEAQIDFSSSATQYDAVDPTVYTTINIGTAAGIGAHAAHNISVGNNTSTNAYNAGSIAIGFNTGASSASEETVAVGFASGVGFKSTHCVYLGAQAGIATTGAAISANFTGTAFNGTNTITTPVHSLTVGEYHVVKLAVLAGSPPPELLDNSILVVFAQSNTSLICTGLPISAGAVGTYSFLSTRAESNNIAIGYQAENVLSSNEVMLGNESHTHVITAGKLYPGTPAGGAFQTAAGMYAGTGAPNNADGSNGDFYLRSDGGALTTIYHKRVGAWVGIV